MCTLVVRVPEPGQGSIRLLAVRDEDPGRPWRPLGEWWPEMPRVRGILDELAGGAWLAVDDHQVAVLVNREGGTQLTRPTSRGRLVLDALSGDPLRKPLTTLGFNLLQASGNSVTVTSWQGDEARQTPLPPGTHMIAHDDVDDSRTDRIRAWLPAFRAAGTDTEPWWTSWFDVLAESARLDPTDPRAIIRDNRPHGYPTLSLLVAAVALDSHRDGGAVHAVMTKLDQPGAWNTPRLR